MSLQFHRPEDILRGFHRRQCSSQHLLLQILGGCILAGIGVVYEKIVIIVLLLK